jgi:hypothetical protein
MAGMFVPKMVPELDTLKAFQGIGKSLKEGIENRRRMEILSGIDPSDPNSLNEATSRLYASGSLDNIYLADRLGQAYQKREGTLYNRSQAEKDREKQGEVQTSLDDIYRSQPGVTPSTAPAPRPPGPPSVPPPDADLLEGGGGGARPVPPGAGLRAPSPGTLALTLPQGRPTPAPPDNMTSMAPRLGGPVPTALEQLPPPPPRPAGAPQPAPRPDVPLPATPQVPQAPAEVVPGVQAARGLLATRPGGAAPGVPAGPVVAQGPPPPTTRPPAPVVAPQSPDTAAAETQYFDKIRKIDALMRRPDITLDIAQRQSLLAERKDAVEEIKRLREPQKEAEKLEAASRKQAMQFDLKNREGFAKQIFQARDQANIAEAELDRFEAIVTNPKYRGGPGTWGPEAIQNFLLASNNIAKGLGMKPKDWSITPQGLVDFYGNKVTEKALLDEARLLSKSLASRKLDVLKGAHSDRDVKYIMGQVANADMSPAGALRAIEIQRVLTQRIKDMAAITADGLSKGQTHAEIQQRLQNYGHKRPMFIGPDGTPTELGRRLGAGTEGGGGRPPAAGGRPGAGAPAGNDPLGLR